MLTIVGLGLGLDLASGWVMNYVLVFIILSVVIVTLPIQPASLEMTQSVWVTRITSMIFTYLILALLSAEQATGHSYPHPALFSAATFIFIYIRPTVHYIKFKVKNVIALRHFTNNTIAI